MDLSEIETRLELTFPPRHRQAMSDDTDPIHEACDFLVPSSRYELLRIIDVNEFLHRPKDWNCWPTYLVAFASNGCGDYFAYDLRAVPMRIVYMDPCRTVDENLTEDDRLEFDCFEDWYESYMSDRPE